MVSCPETNALLFFSMSDLMACIFRMTEWQAC